MATNIFNLIRDKCLDLGGGQSPGNYPICVVEKKVAEKKSNTQEKKTRKYISVTKKEISLSPKKKQENTV